MLTVLTDCVRVRSIGVRSRVDWESDFDQDLDLESVGGDADMDGAEESLGRMTVGHVDLVPEGRSANPVVTASTDAWVLESCLPDVGGEGMGSSRSVLSGWGGGGAGS